MEPSKPNPWLSSAPRAPIDGETPDESFVREYVTSMPASYRAAFSDALVHAHAGVAFRRARAVAHTEVWAELPERVVALCIVADDRPGLLLRISAALVAYDVDVVAAQAYCRPRASGPSEAVDFFWVRRLSRTSRVPVPLRPQDVARIGDTLDTLVRSSASFERTVRFTRALRAAMPPTGARIRFENDPRGAVTILKVEAHDCPGLLFALTRALFEQRVQVVRSDVETREGHVTDRFHVTELDGAPLRPSRLLDLQTAVLVAIDDSSHEAQRKK